jgi:diguanylate cyclase (GGDEF)-like protein/PAS domain S-box-containing protein
MTSETTRGPSEAPGVGRAARAIGIAPRLSARAKRTIMRGVAVLVAINVAVGMAYSVAILRRDGDRHRQISSVMSRIEERLDLQRSLLVAADPSPSATDGVGPPPAIIDGLRSVSELMGDDFGRLARLDPSLDVDRAVAQGSREYLRMMSLLLARFDGGGSEAGVTDEVRKGFDRMADRLSNARSAHDERAREAYRTADVESVLMMALAALMAVLLQKRFVSARRSGDARAARERAQGEARFRSLVQNSKDVILICDQETTIEYQTPSAETVLGFGNDQLVGTRVTELAHPNDARRLFAFCREVSAHPRGGRTIEWRMQHRDGFWMHIESAASNLSDDPNVRGLVLTLRDVSAQRSLEVQLKHQAFHDSLTNLANRALFSDRVGHALMRANRSNRETAVVFVDIDDFKTINDSLGHAAGDELLVEVAERLRKAVRPSDTVARLGGDEFAILLEDASDTTEARMVAERILAEFQSPAILGDRELFIRASIGIAGGNTTEEGAEELLRNADVAMYMAKGAGKGGFVVYEPTMHEAALERLELRAALEHSVEAEEFELHYQPIVDLGTGGISGVEALVRWRRDGELVLPAHFIPLAEETGLIHKLGRWVLMEACRQAREWQQRYPADPPLGMSVNISARQVLRPGLVEAVREALSSSGLGPESLTLEITENDLVLETDEIVGRLRELKDLGVRLAIDDFGTGYSSLSYLGRFPVDVLKIDRSFMARLAHEDESALTHAVVELGHTLSLEVVAEGIEDPEQLTALRALKCGHGQGFYFARPLNEKGVEDLLDQRLPTAATEPAGRTEG